MEIQYFLIETLISIIKKLDQDFDGAIDTFPAKSDAYSYIKTTEDGV